jgi:hypothetical protein
MIVIWLPLLIDDQNVFIARFDVDKRRTAPTGSEACCLGPKWTAKEAKDRGSWSGFRVKKGD